jgi:single-strand DNA-binding protein
MGSVNRVILIGRLGKDPNDRMTGGGTRVSNFSLATNQFRSDATGITQKTTEWHQIVAYGKTAEQCNQFLKKGRLVCVEGSLQSRSWEKPPGEKHYTTEVIAARVTFLDAKTSGHPNRDEAAGDGEDPF